VGATGPAGVGLAVVQDASGTPTAFAILSPDGVSYRLLVTDTGIFLQGPTTTQVWTDTSHFQSLLP
jgi:hypothetical protein